MFTLLLSPCSSKENKLKQLKKPKVGEEIAVVKINFGIIKIRLIPEIAPKAVNSYERLGCLYELDFKHTVFGQVFYGIETVNKISKVKVDVNFQPVEPVVIEKIEIRPYEGDI